MAITCSTSRILDSCFFALSSFAAGLTPASAAAPASVSMPIPGKRIVFVCVFPKGSRLSFQNLLLCATIAARWMLLLCPFRLLTVAPTLLAKPQVETHGLSFACSWSFQPAAAAWRIQTPLADPATFIIFCLVHLFLLFGSKGHCLVANHSTYIAVRVLTRTAQPLFHLFFQ